MSYLSVISLEDAKTHLGVDDTARDAEITRMIKSSLAYLEKRTNLVLFARNKEYIYDSTDCVYVYDHPINSTNSTTHTVEIKESYSIYTDSDNKSITLNVGFTDPLGIDPDLIECGFALIECLFEGGKLSEIPETIELMISANKRFIV